MLRQQSTLAAFVASTPVLATQTSGPRDNVSDPPAAIVAGMHLAPEQWVETQALCAALREGRRVIVSFAFEPTAAVAAIALSGANRVAAYATEPCRNDLRALKTTLALYDLCDPDATAITPLFGPTVLLLETANAYSRPPEACEVVLYMLTMRDIKTHHLRMQTGENGLRAYSKRVLPPGAPIVVHAPVRASPDEQEAMLKTIASMFSVPEACAPVAPPPCDLCVRLETRLHASISDAMLATLRRAINPTTTVVGGTPQHHNAVERLQNAHISVDASQGVSRLRASVRRDVDVISFVKAEHVLDRDVVVVCDQKTSIDTYKRLLIRANLQAVQTVLLDQLLSRASQCLAAARGARMPMIVFADPPMYVAELRAAHAHACAALNRKTAECVVFLWCPHHGDGLASRITAPAPWDMVIDAAASEEIIRAFVIS
jgi:hypothetical protein